MGTDGVIHASWGGRGLLAWGVAIRHDGREGWVLLQRGGSGKHSLKLCYCWERREKDRERDFDFKTPLSNRNLKPNMTQRKPAKPKTPSSQKVTGHFLWKTGKWRNAKSTWTHDSTRGLNKYKTSMPWPSFINYIHIFIHIYKYMCKYMHIIYKYI